MVLHHIGVAHVEVGHVRAKGGQITALACDHPRVFAPNVPALRFLLSPLKPSAVRALRIFQTVFKVGVLFGAVIQNIIHDHTNASGVSLFDQFIKVGQAAIVWVDVAKVGGGVAMVLVGTGGNGHEPNAFNAQVFQVIERLRQALQVSDAIAVAVFVTANKDFHESTVVPVFRQTWRLACQLCAGNERCQQQGDASDLRPDHGTPMFEERCHF